MRHAHDSAGREAGAINAINIIPLADVLLVLLIIFMVTAPAASVTLPMELPRHAPPPPSPPEALVLRIDAAGDVYRNGALLPPADLRAQLLRAGATPADLQPALRIDASDEADYDAVMQVLAAAQDAGLHKVGFVR